MFKIFKLLDSNEKNSLALIILFIVVLGVVESVTFFLLQPIFNYFNSGQFDLQGPFLRFFYRLGQTDRLTDGQTDRQTDGKKFIKFFVCFKMKNIFQVNL
jgi:hypothetical protein